MGQAAPAWTLRKKNGRQRWKTWEEFCEGESWGISRVTANTWSDVVRAGFTEQQSRRPPEPKALDHLQSHAPREDWPAILRETKGRSETDMKREVGHAKLRRVAPTETAPEAPRVPDPRWSGDDRLRVVAPRWTNKGVTLIHGDAERVLAALPANSFHGCLTDPPYGYGPDDESSAWALPSVAVWRQVHRLLKPGASLYASSGTSYAKMRARIGAAGFEVAERPFLWIFDDANPMQFQKGNSLYIRAYDPYVVAKKPGDLGWVLDQKVSDDDGLTDEILGRYGLRLRATDAAVQSVTERIEGIEDTPGEIDQEPYAGDDWTHSILEFREADVLLVLKRGVRYGGQLFFHSTKTPGDDRPPEGHPTLKPPLLCEHLAKLIRPPVADAHLLVPFSGVGSEELGGIRAGWPRSTGIELDPRYIEKAKERVADELAQPGATTGPRSPGRTGVRGQAQGARSVANGPGSPKAKTSVATARNHRTK